MGHRSGSTLHSLRLSWRLRSLAVPICLTEEAGEGLNSQDAKARSQRRKEIQETEEWGIGSGFDSSFFAASLASSLLGCSNLFGCGGRGRIEQPRSQGAKSKRRRISNRPRELGIESGFASSFFAASLASLLLGCSNLFDCGGRGRIEQPRSQGAKSNSRWHCKAVRSRAAGAPGHSRKFKRPCNPTIRHGAGPDGILECILRRD